MAELISIIDGLEAKSHLSPALANIIDASDVLKKLPVILCRYHFGDVIFHKNELYLPTKNGSVPLTKHPEKEKYLSFFEGIFPTIFSINKRIQSTIDSLSQSIPLTVHEPGSLISYSLAPENSNMETIQSGGGFLLPSVGEQGGNKRLNAAYGMDTPPPKTIFEQYSVLTQLAKHTSWQAEILLFPRSWFDQGASAFREYCYQCTLEQSQRWQQLEWIKYLSSQLICQSKLYLNAFMSKSIEHVLALSLGYLPGFAVSDDELTLPIQALEDMYINTYQLRQHAPIFMEPHHFRANSKATYYSLQFPTFFDYASEIYTPPSNLDALKQLQDYLQTFTQLLHEQGLGFLDGIMLRYIHNQAIPTAHIDSSESLPSLDHAMLHARETFASRGLAFPNHCSFFRGCIQLSIQR